MRFSRPLLLALILTFALQPARGEPMREFIMSCSYGALAGTLVGAASLAFSDRPGDNLNKVARGASIGLYAGILLGAYVVYGAPNDEGDVAAMRRKPPRLQLAPLVSPAGNVDGGWIGYTALRF